MAGKEATLVLLDVGASMYERYEAASNQKTKRLDVSVDCLKLMLQNKIFNHKTHEVGLILFGCEESDDQTLYIQEIQKPDLNFVRNVGELSEHDVPQRVGGDIFDALDKAIHTIDEFVGNKKQDKKVLFHVYSKIFIITAGCGDSDYSEKDLQKLVKMVKRSNVKINVIAIDFIDDYNPDHDDPDQPEKYERQKSLMYAGSDKQTPVQNHNQKLLYMMQEELRGQMRIFPAQIAFELYSQFRTRQVSARASFRGEFMINGNSPIQVLIYKKTTEEKLPSLKKFSTLAPYNQDVGTNEVKNDSVFYIQDDPNMTPIDKENMIKGYQYGKQIVPIDSIMEEKMKYKCSRSFSLLGFVERHQVPRHYFMTGVDMVVPIDTERAKKQMSALITALIATKKVALARFVGRDKGTPKLMVLLPHKSENYECFWMIGLPTVEDLRNFQFSSLKKSTPQQQETVAQLIDAMDLTTIPDEEGQPRELLNMKHVVNPTRQYFQQVVMHKAITQSDQIPPISNVILDYLRPEATVLQYAHDELEKVKQLFKFKKHELKKQGEKKVFWKQLFEQDQIQEEEVQEISEMTEQVADMMAKQKFGFEKADDIVKEIGPVNPLEDFRKMIHEKRTDLVDSALTQIQNVIRRLVEESVQGSYHSKALECLKEMRKACITEDEPEQFNNYLQYLKDRYQVGQQELFWANLVKEGITLISITENKTSKVPVDQAANFLHQADYQSQHLVDKLQNEEEELLAEIE